MRDLESRLRKLETAGAVKHPWLVLRVPANPEALAAAEAKHRDYPGQLILVKTYGEVKA